MMGVRIVIAVSRPSYMSIRELSASLLDLLLYWVHPIAREWQIRLIAKASYSNHGSFAAVSGANQTGHG